MRSSEKLDQLLPALAKARVNFDEIKKTQVNLHFGKKYADLSDILPAIVAPLAAEGLVLLGTMEAMTSGEVEVTQRLMHVSEQYLESVTILSYPTGQLQKLGGDVSYFRRYAINTMLALSADEDLDDKLQDEPAKLARKPAARQPEPQIVHEKVAVPPIKSAPVKPTKDEINALVHQMRQVYGEEAIVWGMICAEVQPTAHSGQNWTEYRLRSSMTGEQFQRLTASTERDATQKAAETNGTPPDEDVPLTPGPELPDVSVAQTSPQSEQGESSGTGETHQEPSSAAAEPSAEESPERIALRKEAEGWGISAAEVQHILSHHAMATARTLLWKARQQGLQTTTSEG